MNHVTISRDEYAASAGLAIVLHVLAVSAGCVWLPAPKPLLVGTLVSFVAGVAATAVDAERLERRPWRIVVGSQPASYALCALSFLFAIGYVGLHGLQ